MLVPSVPPKIKTLAILTKTIEKQKLNFSRSVLFYMKTRVILKHFVNDCILLGNLSTLKGTIRADKGTVRADHDF